MNFTDFSLNVTASIVASILVIIGAKITLEKWKKIAIGLGATAIAAVITSFIVFGTFTAVKEFSAYRERSALQEKISTYVKGHYPEAFEKGYKVEIIQMGQRVLMAFIYPGDETYPAPHPLSSQLFSNEMKKLLNDNGCPGEPAWTYEMKPYTNKQVTEMIKRQRN